MVRKYSRIIAVFLLLVFSQKAGLRLWMHHWLHESRTTQSQSSPSSADLQLKCDCFDDAMMPLLDSPFFITPAPVQQFATLTVPRRSTLLSADKIYYSLKGPPADAARASRTASRQLQA